MSSQENASRPSLRRVETVLDPQDFAVKMIAFYPDTDPLIRPLTPKEIPGIVRYHTFDEREDEDEDHVPTFDPKDDGKDKGTGTCGCPEDLCSLREGSIRASVFNLCSATLGAGALSLPYAFKQSGLIPGIILLWLGGAATDFSIKLLIKARDASGARSYEDLTVQVLGQRVGVIMELCVIIFCFGCAVAYLIAVGDILEGLIGNATIFGIAISRLEGVIAVFLFVMLPLSLLDSVNDLRFPSLLGVCSIFFLVVAACIHTVSSFSMGHISSNSFRTVSLVNWDRPSGMLLALPVMIFAYTCQTNVFSVYHELSRPSSRRMRKVSYRAVAICFTIYLLMGTAGYLNFGSATRANILQNYAHSSKNQAQSMQLLSHSHGGTNKVDIPVSGGTGLLGSMMTIASLAVIITVVVAFPLVIFPCRFTMGVLLFGYEGIPHGEMHSENDLKREDGNVPVRRKSSHEVLKAMPWWVHCVITLALCGSALLVSMFVPNISTVFALMGSTASSFVCFVLPALLALTLIHRGKLEYPSTFQMIKIVTLAVGGAGLGAASTVLTLMADAS